MSGAHHESAAADRATSVALAEAVFAARRHREEIEALQLPIDFEAGIDSPARVGAIRRLREEHDLRRLETELADGFEATLTSRDESWSIDVITSRSFCKLVPEGQGWLLIATGLPRRELKRPITGRSWIFSSASQPEPLPGWVVAEAAVPGPRKSALHRARKTVPEGLRARLTEDARLALRPLRDAFEIIEWERQRRARACRTIHLRALAPDSDGRSDYELREALPEGGRLGVKISGFAGDYVIFADPDQADRWILNGPPGLPEAVEIEPLPDDRYRLQRKALNEILNKACLSFEFVAAAGTQTQIPDELLPKWRQRLGLDGVRPESVSEIDILPGEESKPWEDRQRQALTLALSDRPLCAIKGPPGTGKSAVIVSLVRRLARAGQRVLFVAPQHVAVDEVLHRLHELREQGDETSVTAVRVAPRDESRIDRRLRMYLPDRVSEAVRDEVLARAERALSELGDRDDVTADLERVRAEIPWLEEVCTFEDNLAGTVANIEKAGEERAAIFSEIIRQESVRDREAKALEDSWLPRFLNFGPSGRHAAAVSTLEELRPKARELETRILDLEAAEEKATAAIETGLESCRKRFGEWLPTETTRTRLKALLARREQLGWRLEEAELRLRWRDEAQTQEADIRFRDAVLDSANLIASTTQGIATNPFLRDQSFDVLICDESSRATRGELLVAASRCSRIILVGDEKQLPPYVDRDEELLFQALALRDLRTECQDLDQAVEQLQAGWNEGADLDWRRVYESDVKTCLERLESTGDPPGPRRRLQEWRELYDAASRSCFDHALSQLRGEDCVRLDVQRRMPDSIARIVRNPVYGGDFRSGEHARKAHPGGDWYFYDTSPRAAVRNSKYREKFADRGFWNDGEADDVARLVGREASAWRAAFGGTPSIMVITFYRQHAREILRRLDGRRDVPRGVIVLPIDQCQGREADVVILSFARTHASPRPNWGLWLQEPRRLNVALTRARQRLIIVGSLATIAKMRGNIEGQAILSSLANEVSLQRTRVFDV